MSIITYQVQGYYLSSFVQRTSLIVVLQTYIYMIIESHIIRYKLIYNMDSRMILQILMPGQVYMNRCFLTDMPKSG